MFRPILPPILLPILPILPSFAVICRHLPLSAAIMPPHELLLFESAYVQHVAVDVLYSHDDPPAYLGA